MALASALASEEQTNSTTAASSCVNASPSPLLRVAWTAPTSRPFAINGTHSAASSPVSFWPGYDVPMLTPLSIIVRCSLTARAIGIGACSISTNAPAGTSAAFTARTNSRRLLCSVFLKTAQEWASTRRGKNSRALATTSLASSESCIRIAASKIDRATDSSCIFAAGPPANGIHARSTFTASVNPASKVPTSPFEPFCEQEDSEKGRRTRLAESRGGGLIKAHFVSDDRCPRVHPQPGRPQNIVSLAPVQSAPVPINLLNP